MDDEFAKLISRLRAGIEREESARRLDRLLRPRLARYFASIGTATTDVDDVVQQTLIRVFQHVEGLRSEERFLPWLFTVARNVARSAARRNRPEMAGEAMSLERVASEGARSGPSDWVARERLARVERLVGRLPEQQRRCLVLVVRDELSYQRAGELLGVSPLTVRNHLAKARRRLRRELEEEERRR